MDTKAPDIPLTLHQQRRLALGIPLDAAGFQNYTLERDEIFKDRTMEEIYERIEELEKQREAGTLVETGA